MRRAWTLLPFLLLACDSEEPPPGEVVGTFSFVATLDTGEPAAEEELPRCLFSGAPPRIAFDGTLSHDRQTDQAWLQIDGSLRQGELHGAAFRLGLQPEADGSVRAVPRTLDACDCELFLVESMQGRLVKSGCTTVLEDGTVEAEPEEPATELGPDTCPRIDEAGELAWDTCGGACGTLEERVRFGTGTACICEVEGAGQHAPASGCAFVYGLQATRIGGRG